MPYQRISVTTAKELIEQQNAHVIDIRDDASFEKGHIENARLINNNNVHEFIDSADPEQPLIVCCYHGNMSQGTAEYFSELNFTSTYSLDGGYSAWARFHSG